MQKKWILINLLLTSCLVVCVPQLAPQTQRTLAQTPSKMTVDDVITMLQVHLGDDLIIAQIRKNKTTISLSADDMIRLKKAGASDDLIRVMMDPQLPPSPGSPSAETRTPATQPSSPLPSSYGYYLVDDKRLAELHEIEVVTKFGLTLADRGFAVDGLPEEVQPLRVASPTPTIIVFQQDVQTNALQLSALSLLRTLKAYQFNIINTAPQFFSNVYRKDPNETIPINLWRPDHHILVHVEPVEGKPGMYKLVPDSPLEAGKYALYLPDSLHDGDVVFSASTGREASAFAFEVIGGTNSDTPPSDHAQVSAVRGGPEFSLAGVSIMKLDGSSVYLLIEAAGTRYAFGARKTATLAGNRAEARVNQHDKIQFHSIVLAGNRPPEAGQFRLFQFEVKNGKRTAMLKSGLTCSVSCSGESCLITPDHELTIGEYGFGVSNPNVPVEGGIMKVLTFGVDP